MSPNRRKKSKRTSNKMTAVQMHSVIKFLICLNVILLVTIVVLSVMLAKNKSGATEAISITKPKGDFSVCIDAGHGGSDTGAIGIDGTYEKDDNLELALKVADILEDNGVNVIMTRDDDTYISLEDRASVANEKGVDVFVSLHRNYAESESASGVEAWIYSSGSDKNYALAEDILANLENVGVSENRGVKSGTRSGTDSDYMVIRDTNMTSVIIETGFISNEEDIELFNENTNDYAAAIANGIIEWLNEYCQ